MHTVTWATLKFKNPEVFGKAAEVDNFDERAF